MRFWEIDFARGLAIVMMVAYHTAWDLDYLSIIKIPATGASWSAFQTLTASIFLILVGVSLSISSKREPSPRRLIFRAATVFGLGMVITLVTRLVVPEGFVVFGILHLIALSLILAYPFRNLSWANIPLAAGVIIAGLKINCVTGWLLFLGCTPANFYSVDFYPVLPWFGLVLIGLSIGNMLYDSRKRKFILKNDGGRYSKPLCFLGRHSLAIYMLHQVIIFGGLLLLRNLRLI